VTDSSPRLDSLLAALDSHGVVYVVIGSVAALAHGAPGEQPADLDVAPATDRDNLDRLAAALRDLHARPTPERGEWRVDEAGERAWVEDGELRPARELDPGDSTTFDHSFQTAHGRLDVVPVVAGTHAELRGRASWLSVAGREAWVAHPADVLAGMTGPRRPKDGPRVRHLRGLVNATSDSGVGFVGIRTERFDEMVGLFRDAIGLRVVHEAPGATWFRLGDDAELHVYAATDRDHAFFTTGPVVGLRVDDLEATRVELEASGVEMLTDVERSDTAAWCHFRAPDGTVLEIIGPATP
jgi:hypothetical protein